MANDKDKSEKIEDVKENTKRPAGRPPLEFPEPIDAEPEEIAKAMFGVEPKKANEWRYTQEANKTKR